MSAGDGGPGGRIPPRPSGSRAYAYDAAYQGVPNWDVGYPQRAFVAVEEAGGLRPPVLDVGCGTGELTMFFARRGYRALGIDLSSRAVATARRKAARRRIDADFLVWDALELPALGLRFRTVVDSATMHVVGDADRDRYVAGLAAVLAPGGRFVVVGDARREDAPWGYGLSQGEIRDRFGGDRWTVELLTGTTFERRYSTNPAYLAVVRRN